jgi:hypothetical protein
MHGVQERQKGRVTDRAMGPGKLEKLTSLTS